MNAIEQLELNMTRFRESVARFQEAVNSRGTASETLVNGLSETQVLQISSCSDAKPPTLTCWERLPSNQAAGIVSGHPRFTDGTYVRTSEVAEWGEQHIVTRNRIYALRAPRFLDRLVLRAKGNHVRRIPA